MARHEEQVSKHFKRYEVECHGEDCCRNSYPVADSLMGALDTHRDNIGQAVSLSNAYRCLKHNQTVGSNDESKHPKGKAADLQLHEGGWTVEQMRDALVEIPAFSVGGIGLYEWGVHADIHIREGGLYLWDARSGWSNR